LGKGLQGGGPGESEKKYDTNLKIMPAAGELGGVHKKKREGKLYYQKRHCSNGRVKGPRHSQRRGQERSSLR